MSKELIERLESDSYSLPAVNGEWIYRDGNNMPRNSCTEAADLIERQSARIAELERENAELRSLLPDSDRAKKITERAAIRAENKKLHAQLVAAKKAKG